MLGESLPAIWASMNSWFTPTVLFLLLNLMIGTIAVTSGLASPKSDSKQPQHQQQQPLVRTPSIIERLKSINLHRYRSQDLNPITTTTTTTITNIFTPPELETVKTFETSEEFHEPHVTRTVSDTKPTLGGEKQVKLPRKMRKSASAKSAFAHFEEEEMVEIRVPLTVREKKTTSEAFSGEDECVDEKADDFINKFKQQLKLQRLDSIIRYKEMLNRGAK
ncbi:hypothetical protein GIB67_041494 [Kingdonia uniflora]|uniref:DUF4408 domain-containing protein n=1 Tax=Kingdonia uniflora TaxID=39325 RepID=A0A7J7MQ71_9MAGN|nr:hypothetical protein GIB67_041494 [Kingdonia uniflora]